MTGCVAEGLLDVIQSYEANYCWLGTTTVQSATFPRPRSHAPFVLLTSVTLNLHTQQNTQAEDAKNVSLKVATYMRQLLQHCTDASGA